jgi:hypothetical protein
MGDMVRELRAAVLQLPAVAGLLAGGIQESVQCMELVYGLVVRARAAAPGADRAPQRTALTGSVPVCAQDEVHADLCAAPVVLEQASAFVPWLVSHLQEQFLQVQANAAGGSTGGAAEAPRKELLNVLRDSLKKAPVEFAVHLTACAEAQKQRYLQGEALLRERKRKSPSPAGGDGRCAAPARRRPRTARRH